MEDTAFVDIVGEQDEMVSHRLQFVLWPRMWQEYQVQLGLQWEICRLSDSTRLEVPERPGIYTFVIQPMLFNHPACAYLAYVGKTVNLRQRFVQYLTTERREKGRPKIFRLLTKYPDNLWFCYSEVLSEYLDSVEERLITAFIPPCNDRFPARLGKIVGAF